MFENSEQYTANKILILFILDRLGTHVTDNHLSAVLLAPGLVNYFTIQECREDLIAKGCIYRELDSGGSVLYSITDKGRERLNQLKYMLSGGLGAVYEAYLKEHKDEITRSMYINADSFDDEAGNTYVRCYIREGANCIVDVKLPVGSRKDANEICDAWKKGASDIYIKIMKTFYDKINNK